ncbi:hypothetical protein [Lactiplantibacillus carotarum]|uniref:hypothetical protein n=1 Tax=Lactiplantibacillus carotarum TaxID=2993456 RepID=UPI00298F3667|nr:hypothetical protein [Lactiplantibacillus carotarum]
MIGLILAIFIALSLFKITTKVGSFALTIMGTALIIMAFINVLKALVPIIILGLIIYSLYYLIHNKLKWTGRQFLMYAMGFLTLFLVFTKINQLAIITAGIFYSLFALEYPQYRILKRMSTAGWIACVWVVAVILFGSSFIIGPWLIENVFTS